MSLRALALFAVLLPVAALGAPIVETATFGPLEYSYQGGTVVGRQFLAVRFEVTSTVTTGTVGGHFRYDYYAGSVFAAIVSLTGPSDYPDSFDLSTPDLVASTLIGLPPGYPYSRDYEAALEVTLTPGWYALLFGGDGLFGATADTDMPATNHDIGEPDYFARLATPQDWNCYNDDGPPCTYDYSWLEGGFSRTRMYIQPIPEPSPMLLIGIGLIGLRIPSRGRRRARRS